jgi:hypothetical protein
MNLKNQPPLFVPKIYRSEIERLSKAALMDMVWDLAQRCVGATDNQPRQIMEEIQRTAMTKPMKKETATQRRRRMTLGGTVEKYDDAFFKNAKSFEVHHITGFHERHARVLHSFPSFILAMDMAKKMRDAVKKDKSDDQYLVRAIHTDGRFITLVSERWDYFRQLWLRMHPKSTGRSRRNPLPTTQ